jgi:hypothetical protein
MGIVKTLIMETLTINPFFREKQTECRPGGDAGFSFRFIVGS